jgi:hypothetical protein
MSQLSVAIASARSLLNDVQGITYSDPILVPKAQEAFREMLIEIELNSLGVIKFQSAVVSVPQAPIPYAGPFVMPNVPSNLIEPISLLERRVGNTYDDFIEMDETTFIPAQTPVQDLMIWAWMQQQIWLVGATEAKEVLIRYNGTLATPVRLTDEMGFIFAELYVGPRTAELVDKQDHNAAMNLDSVIRYNVLSHQRPVRRRGYRSLFRLRRYY